MTSISQRGAGARKVDIKTQLNATHNPLFPFSSPNPDDLSLKSGRSGHTFQSQNPFESDLSTPPLDIDRESTSDRDEFHLERYSQHIKQQQLAQEKAVEKKTRKVKNIRPNLHVDTTPPEEYSRAGNLVINQVAAKQPMQGRNRARSIVSQKGIQVIPSPQYWKESAQAFSKLEGLISKKREEKPRIKDGSNRSQALTTKKPTSSLRSSVIFGLSLPEYQAALHPQGTELNSAVTLITPATPTITITLARGNDAPSLVQHLGRHRANPRKISPTSIYTDESPVSDQSDTVKADSLPPQRSLYTHPGESKGIRRLSSDSQHVILADSPEATRPKSQGWWNLMLSPMLSRAGTLKGQRFFRDETIPPVPPVPADLEKVMPSQTPVTNMSPLTPRRLGLAGIRTSTGSDWTQWEDEEEEALDELNDQNIGEIEPTLPSEYLAPNLYTGMSFVMGQDLKHEGLAVEYYHACAVELLSNTTYFECINHSCCQRLPKLCSIYDANDQMGFIPIELNEKKAKDSDDIPIHLAHMTMESNESAQPTHVQYAKNGSAPPANSSAIESSPITPIDSDVDAEEFVSPNVRHAKTAAFSKPRAVQSKESLPTLAQTRAESPEKKLNVKPAIFTREVIQSPGPVSPEATRTIAPSGAVHMAPMQSSPPDSTGPLVAPVPQAVHTQIDAYRPLQPIVYYPYAHPVQYPLYPQTLPQHPAVHRYATTPGSQNSQAERFVVPVLYHEPGKQGDNGLQENLDTQNETRKDIEGGKRKKKKMKVFGVFCCFATTKKDPKKKRWCISISITLLLVIAACILFAIFFSRGKADVGPTVSQWLNLTGYPPAPTGIYTITQPKLATFQDQCVRPSTLWSCALPKEDQAAIAPNAPNQPNFRFQIRFRNGTVPANMTAPLGKRASGSGDDDLFVASPSPPGRLDQIFMGNTTDNVTLPFEGEVTPFFITFVNPASAQASTSNQTKKVVTRQSTGGDFSDLIPAPSIGADGTAAPVSLLPTNPLPFAQPLKLYNRGLRDEHYGFYIYYDKSIFLSGISLRTNVTSNVDADQNGGSTKSTANVRCTWSQTRFLVRIYTNPAFNARLLPSTSTNTNTATNNSTTQSALDRSGSFPYPTTISIDRHGGDQNRKFVYCYGMSPSDTKINTRDKRLVFENRSFGGVPINPSRGPITTNSSSGTGFDPNIDGIDGGSGGCGCEWRNWN